MSVPCAGCNTTKAEADFYPSTLRRGHAFRCKDCMRDSARALATRRGARRKTRLRTETEMECGRCEHIKPLAAFYPSLVESGGAGWCRDCTRSYYRALHESRPGLHAEIQRKQRRRKRDYVRSFKDACAECGESHPAVLDLHHIDPSAKSFNLSWAVANNRALGTLRAEVEKCVVLCANCHRKHHWNETHSTDRADAAQSA